MEENVAHAQKFKVSCMFIIKHGYMFITKCIVINICLSLNVGFSDKHT